MLFPSGYIILPPPSRYPEPNSLHRAHFYMDTQFFYMDLGSPKEGLTITYIGKRGSYMGCSDPRQIRHAIYMAESQGYIERLSGRLRACKEAEMGEPRREREDAEPQA